MPVDHSNNGFFKDLGSDWLAIAANGEPVARAATEDGVRRAAPNAADYVTGKQAAKVPELKHLGPAGSDPVAAATQHQPEHTFEETLLHVEKTHDPQASREDNIKKAEIAESTRQDSLEGQAREKSEQAKAEAADPNAAKAQAAVDKTEDEEKPEAKEDDKPKARRQRKPAEDK